jgi:hypothetical protein
MKWETRREYRPETQRGPSDNAVLKIKQNAKNKKTERQQSGRVDGQDEFVQLPTRSYSNKYRDTIKGWIRIGSTEKKQWRSS